IGGFPRLGFSLLFELLVFGERLVVAAFVIVSDLLGFGLGLAGAGDDDVDQSLLVRCVQRGLRRAFHALEPAAQIGVGLLRVGGALCCGCLSITLCFLGLLFQRVGI